MTNGAAVVIGTYAAEEGEQSDSVVIGRFAGRYASNGFQNVFLGNNAGGGTTGVTTSPHYNTFVGYGSGSAIVDGDNNVFLGNQAGNTTTTGSDNILLGDQVNASAATASNELNIGDTIFGNLATNAIGIGVADATAIDTDAILELDATDKGFLAPRVSDPATAIGTPATGMMAYDTATSRYQYYDGGAWQDFGFGVGGDNLGNHTATTDLDMNNNNIVNPTVISFNGTTGAAAPTK